MPPSRSPFPLGSLYRRVKTRVSTYRHGWFKVLVWVLFGAMSVLLFPAMVAAWFWRLSYRPSPRGGRRISMLLLMLLAGVFQLLWLNALIIDPMAGIGEALNQPAPTSDGPVAADSPSTGEDQSAPAADETQSPVQSDEPAESDEVEAGGTPPASAVAEAVEEVTVATSPPTAPVVTESAPSTNQPTAGDARVMAGLAVGGESHGGVSYDRDLYGGWTRVRSGCNTRCAVLEEEQRADGTWLSWYDGRVISNSSDLDIDHMVPLAEAHSSGAWQWSSSRKRDFANNLVQSGALTAVSASSNRSKGSRDPAEWRPPQRGAWCRYATDWITVKVAWGLTADQAEVRALEEMLDTCGSEVAIVTVTATTAATLATTTTTFAALVESGFCPYTSQAGDPCAAVPALGNQSNDVNCGDIPSRFKPLTVVGQDYDRLDGNNDGVACS